MYDFNANCVKAYQLAISLRLEPAKVLIEQEKKDHPQNIVPFFIENYIDFFILFLNEDPAEYADRKNNKKTRLSIIESGPTNSPLRDFMVSVVELQWAAIDIKFGNRWAAGWEFRDALRTAKANQQRFPEFSPSLMISGPLQMAAAAVPKGYRWLTGLIGVSGNIEKGKLQIKQFLNAKDPWAKLFMDEGIFYHCYFMFHMLNQQDEALAFIKQQKLDVVNNHLFTFMAANLYLNHKQSQLAKAVITGRNQSSDYMTSTVWDFEMAYAKLYHLEPDANQYFNRFIQNFKGNFYLKEVWHRLSFYYLLQGNQQEYLRCRNMVLKVGKQETDADKRAYNEAKSGKVPHLLLLKARLLSDGGFHKEAMLALEGKNSNDFTNPSEKLEFVYRVARIYDDLQQSDKAIATYLSAIELGKSSTEYFAARAALQIGLIYEKRKQNSLAIQYYQQCIDFEGHDYENSLEQKAKAGIARCRNEQ